MILEQCKTYWRNRVCALLQDICENNPDIVAENIRIQHPPSNIPGDLSLPLFSFARYAKCAPHALALELQKRLEQEADTVTHGRAEAVKGYLNIHLNRTDIVRQVLATHTPHETQTSGRIAEQAYITSLTSLPFEKQKICIEFSSPNTNKPLHLGHLRNNVIGASIARILQYCGAEVTKINLINDRGVHICKSMAAYMRFGNGKTPQELGIRSDVFVGDYYVRFAEWEKEDSSATKEAQDLLRKWEAKESKTRQLWEKMRQWVLDGIDATYRRTGIDFDAYQYESDTYLLGKEIVMQGVNAGVFYYAEDGSIEIDLSDVGLDIKKLLRKDGTTIYMTQDLGTAVQRYEKLTFDRLIYVVANEQEYHFKALFEIVSRLDFPLASQLFHRSYGVVKLPDGKMKSREGTVVDADDLIDTVRLAIMQEMEQENSYRKKDIQEQQQTLAEKIAISSIHYWLVKFAPETNITFDTKQSISFSGNSGAYILYTITRIRHLLLHAKEQAHEETGAASMPANVLAACLTEELEWQLVSLIIQFPEVVQDAAHSHTPFPIAQYLYQLTQTFSRYYHDVPIAVTSDPTTRTARLSLVTQLLAVLEQCCYFLLMPTVENM